jgi:mannose-6-phosphate isomerase-like protein (cupin superfamily)
VSPNLTLADALASLQANADFVRLLEKPSFDVSLYKPQGHDPQSPHARDELYVVASGSGYFYCDGKSRAFRTGDAFFVPAGTAHHFADFSADFSTWVIFFGLRP